MSKKRKRSDDAENSQICLPQSFREITQMTNGDLNTLLKDIGLSTKGKRNHKVTLLANQLGIPTTQSTQNDPFLQTLMDINTPGEGWIKDLRQVPEVKLQSIINYLLAAHDVTDGSHGDFEKYTSTSLRSYKALRSYDLWESGHISGFLFNPLKDMNDYSALKCIANPSGDTSGTQYQVTVVLKENGDPIGASCSCVAGLGEACTHIAGLLFGVEDFVSRGYKELPDTQATTEKLCKWIVPRGPKVEPKPVKGVSVKKNIPGEVKKEKVFRASDYDPLPTEKRPVVLEDLKQLHHALSLHCPQLPWVRAVAPAIIRQHASYQASQDLVIRVPDLPSIVSVSDPILVPSRVTEVSTSYEPVPLLEKVKLMTTNSDFDSLAYTGEEMEMIENLTREQSSSVWWYKYRQGLITASNFQRVASHVSAMKKIGESDATKSLIDTLITGGNFKGNAATKYGKKQEPKAIKAYRSFVEGLHEKAVVKNSGLVLNRDHPFLGASPDGIMKCRCHGKRVVEVKSPLSLLESNNDSMGFLKRDDAGNLELKKSGNTYYAQIQGQMGITGVHLADLVVWDGRSVTVISISFDKDYWERLGSVLSNFYRQFVMPALMKKQSQVLKDRQSVQNSVSIITQRYQCGKCGQSKCSVTRMPASTVNVIVVATSGFTGSVLGTDPTQTLMLNLHGSVTAV